MHTIHAQISCTTVTNHTTNRF